MSTVPGLRCLLEASSEPKHEFHSPFWGDRGRAPIVFQQDGATCHTSISTRRFLAQNRVNVLPEWLANSPDMNPVENCWSWLARRLVGQSFATEEALEQAIRNEWRQRGPSLIHNLYASLASSQGWSNKAKACNTSY